ncbi:hypothetical protein PT015_12150 [Candidatus Mycobacterium wuenschmannii]|uniref:Uncharacterized protein n=1 Tax=Candidatus Mycobacterium wuenschmannii TaxID=3027808 RepID=A0ABY8VQ01_9MYCO|nr:hypothetical protein [Candidatus Mycobacterium wuenschmannii]WIM85714.1 hypothetical protein PT015_12150 [Candidatus Mycobacterium wuenschmannii]
MTVIAGRPLEARRRAAEVEATPVEARQNELRSRCVIHRNIGHVGPFPREGPTSSLFRGTNSAHRMSRGFFINLALDKLDETDIQLLK